MQARHMPIARDFHALRAIKARGVEAVSKAAITSIGATAITALLIIAITVLSALSKAAPESLSYSLIGMVGFMTGSATVETVKAARTPRAAGGAGDGR